MRKKDFTLTSKILMSLLTLGDMILITPKELRRMAWRGEIFGESKNFYSTVWYLYKKGWIKYENKENKRFLKLTKNGQLEALLAKAKILNTPIKWDGKWRLIIFDIPEESEHLRNFFRYLLKKHGFVKLQHSVYINPYPLNRDAVEYLKKTNLMEFIRILKVEEMDSDKDLKKIFKLK